MLIKGKNPLVKKAGLMAALLGAGDSFHLVPRAYALWTTGLAANAAALGVGKFITSITMTIFYLILYYIWRDRYQIKDRKSLTTTMWVLSVPVSYTHLDVYKRQSIRWSLPHSRRAVQ